MRHCETIDIEDAIQQALNADGIRACAPPVPADLSAPMAIVWRIGGSERAYVQDVHSVSIDCYAATDAEAAAMANRMTAWVRALPGQELGGVPVYTASVSTLPYLNTDPGHPTLARCTLACEVATRVRH